MANFRSHYLTFYRNSIECHKWLLNKKMAVPFQHQKGLLSCRPKRETPEKYIHVFSFICKAYNNHKYWMEKNELPHILFNILSFKEIFSYLSKNFLFFACSINFLRQNFVQNKFETWGILNICHHKLLESAWKEAQHNGILAWKSSRICFSISRFCCYMITKWFSYCKTNNNFPKLNFIFRHCNASLQFFLI